MQAGTHGHKGLARPGSASWHGHPASLPGRLAKAGPSSCERRTAPTVGPGRCGSAVAPEHLGTVTPPGLGTAKLPESVNLSGRWRPPFLPFALFCFALRPLNHLESLCAQGVSSCLGRFCACGHQTWHRGPPQRPRPTVLPLLLWRRQPPCLCGSISGPCVPCH